MLMQSTSPRFCSVSGQLEQGAGNVVPKRCLDFELYTPSPTHGLLTEKLQRTAEKSIAGVGAVRDKQMCM